MSLKGGTATLVAIVFLLGGVEVAHAGGIGDVVASVPVVADTALPKTEDVVPGDVVDETTGAVDQATEAVGEAVPPVDGGALASAGTETVHEAAADPKGTVENTVDSTVHQVAGTVDGITGDARNVVGSASVGKAARGGTDVAASVASATQEPGASHSNAAEPAPSAQQSEGAQPRASRALKRPQPGLATPAQSTSSGARIVVAAIVTAPISGAEEPLLTGGLLPPSVGWRDALGAPEPTMSHKASSAAPAAPFAPVPGDLPATSASVAGSAGAALVFVLFSAFLVLAPRNGRLARPGPNLARPEPCLSLPERPG